MGSYRAIHEIHSFIGHHSNRPGQDGQGTITNLMADMPAIPQVLFRDLRRKYSAEAPFATLSPAK